MASKAQRAAVRSRADKVNAAIGSFRKVKTILPLVFDAPETVIKAPEAPTEVSISSVFGEVGEPYELKLSATDLAYEAAYWASVDRDNAERIYAEADAEDRAALAHINTPEYLAQMAEIMAEIDDAPLMEMSQEEIDRMKSGAYDERTVAEMDYDENVLNTGNAFAGG